MLYKSAYDQAMREYEAGAITDKERQKRIAQLQKDIRDERKEIARLERGQLTENERRERMRKREELRLGTKTVRTPTGATAGTAGTTEVVDDGIPTINEFQDKLQKEESKLRQDKVRASNEVRKFTSGNEGKEFKRALQKKNSGGVLVGRNKAVYDANIEGYEKAVADEQKTQTALTAKQTQIQKVNGLDNQEQFEEYYRTDILRGADPSQTKRGRGRDGAKGSVTSKQLAKGTDVSLPDVDYSQLIEEREGRIGDIERQILELESEPTEPRINVLDRTSEITRDRYGLGQPRRRLFGRRAEMEALDMEPEVEEEAVEEVEVDPVAQEMSKGEVLDREVQAPTEQRYTVQEGDTLGSVAEKYYGDPKRYTDIAKASGIQDPNRIEVGQELTVPLDAPEMVTEPVVDEVVDEVVEEQPIAPIQPKPARTEIGDKLRQSEQERQAREEEMPTVREPERSPFQEASPEDLMKVTGDLRKELDKRDSSTSPAPAPIPSIRKLGTIRPFDEAMGTKPRQPRRPLPPIQQVRAAFDPVRNLDRKAKQRVGFQLLQQAKQAFGVSSPEYKKAKQQILSELGKSINPKKAKQMKLVKNLQETAPSQYAKLGDDIRGLSEESKRMVIQLFPVNDDTKVDEIEGLYKNAQQQLRLSIPDRKQKKKALDMLDLMYMAVISDKR